MPVKYVVISLSMLQTLAFFNFNLMSDKSNKFLTFFKLKKGKFKPASILSRFLTIIQFEKWTRKQEFKLIKKSQTETLNFKFVFHLIFLLSVDFRNGLIVR